jgi:toxin YoeB
MKVVWTPQAVEDFQYWQSHDPKICDRIRTLVDCTALADITAHPFVGIGKPEPLKRARSGYWSRRIDYKHRLVYRVAGDPPELTIVQCRYHY